jgi:putative inorganic carbon (HCO3(-)) transporter
VSDTANPNVMAGSLVIFFPIIMGLCLFGWNHLRWYEASLSMLALVSITVILALTQSRGGLIALVAFFLVMALLRWRWGWVLLLMGISTTGAAIAWIGVTPVLNAVLSSTTLGGIEGRLEVWSRAVYMIQDFPFTGVGMGSYAKVADLLYPFFLYEPGKVEHAHNLFLQIAVDLGIPGLIAWLAILVVVSVIAWQVYHKGRITHNGWYAGLGAGLLCSQVALVVHGMLDSVTWGMVRPAPIVWAIWGLIVTSGCIQYQTAKISVQG